MEQVIQYESVQFKEQLQSTSKPFIEANTVGGTIEEVKNHLIPVYFDNQPAMSHYDFIDTAFQVVSEEFQGEQILFPSIRLSHPIKGRISDAKDKAYTDLEENEKTIFYDRMAFVIEIPSITSEIAGNRLSLIVGGVKSYSLDNLYSKRSSGEGFKIFIGFQNSVCTNCAVFTDGFMKDIKVSSLGQLKSCIRTLVNNYNSSFQLFEMKLLSEHFLTESQFASIIGRARIYPHLPKKLKESINALALTDTQIGMIVRDYYTDTTFGSDENGGINLWRLYNLFTGANKSSYIDNFLDRSVNAYNFVESIRFALQNKSSSWYLS